MNRLEELRFYYNHTIHPELLRLDKKRKKLLRLLFISLVLLIALIFLQFYVNIFVFSLFLFLIIGVYISIILYRIQEFRLTYKPHVVNLLTDFIDNDINYGTMYYDAQKSIEKPTFLASGIFVTDAPEYEGEDYFSGKIGDVTFEMSELGVKEFSPVRSRLNYVFRGMFLHARFRQPLEGAILILPRKFKQYLSKTLRAFTQIGGKELDSGIHNMEFEETFMTYATANANFDILFSDEMKEDILKYRAETGNEIYISFVYNDIYVAVTNQKDLLEPFIFQSNISFDLIREYYENIELLLRIIEDFDKHN